MAKTDPYSAVNSIYRLKGEWDTANNAGDEKAKNNAAARAQAYYNQLRSNGYSDVADDLSRSNYEQAKAIRNKWAAMDKSPTRPYFYELGKKYGMSSGDVDKLIGWNGSTGQVSFGGKVIGTPDAIVDGTSYWKDTSVLDNAFNDYISRSGTVRSKPMAVQQENENLFQKYNREYDDLKNTNPFTTEEAKSILAKYDLSGLQGRNNATASGAAANGGNIDSFAAANALRQQAAMVNQGQQAVLSAYQQKLDHAKSLLSDMGVHIDRVYNQDETSKNNDVARKSEIASVTGYAPDEWVASNNPYMNEDGTIKDAYKNVDFSEIMKNAKASGNTSAYNAAAMARFYKIMGNYGAYGQYDDGNYTVPGLKKTEAARQFDEQIAASDRALNAEAAAANAEAAAKRDIANIEAKSKLDQIKATTQYGAPATGKSSGMTLAQATAAIKNGELSDAALSVYNANHGTSYTKDNPPPIAENGASWNQPSDGSNTENNDEKLNEVYDKSDDTVKKYIRNCLKPLITENSITEEELKNHLINNSYEYDLEVKDIKNICEALGVDSMWVDGYKNRGLFGWGSGVKEKK